MANGLTMSYICKYNLSFTILLLLTSLILINQFTVSIAFSADQPPIEPTMVEKSPFIDGVLNDESWKHATIISDFKQRSPEEGAEPTEKTEVMMIYTSDALYIGVKAFDSFPESIVGTVMKRDNSEIATNDQFAIAIDSYNDGRNGYWISTNPLGVRVDAQFFDEGDIFEFNWDGIWECKTSLTNDGWIAEIRIPFSTMRFKAADENIMGINLFRRIIRTNEELYAPLIPLRYVTGTPTVSAARKYLFRGINGGRNILLKPYALSGMQDIKVDGNLTSATEGELGADLKYNITDNLVANISYNTDFAQAEVDEQQVNLSRFSLFFPEKRDFFLENSGIYSFGLLQDTEIFFSRRIGLTFDSSGNSISVPIVMGGKLTGKVNQIDLGALNVQTNNHNDIPSENFSVFRFKAGIAPRSYVGGILTNVSSENGIYDRTIGGDLNYIIKKDVGVRAFSATNLSSENSKINTESSVFDLSLFRASERFSFNIEYLDVGATFNPRIGFIRRTDIQRVKGFIKNPKYIESEKYWRLVPEYSFEIVQDHNGEPLDSKHAMSFSLDFQSLDQILFTVSRTFKYLPVEFPIFKDVIVSVDRYTYYNVGIQFTSKPGRKISSTIVFAAGGLLGGSNFMSQLSGRWKVNENLTLSQIYEQSDVSFSEDSFTTRLIRSRINYSMNTSLSAAVLVQYDNESEQFGINVRFNYLFTEGTELFMVYNQINDNPEISERFTLGQKNSGTLLIKFNYLFSL